MRTSALSIASSPCIHTACAVETQEHTQSCSNVRMQDCNTSRYIAHKGKTWRSWQRALEHLTRLALTQSCVLPCSVLVQQVAVLTCGHAHANHTRVNVAALQQTKHLGCCTPNVTKQEPSVSTPQWAMPFGKRFNATVRQTVVTSSVKAMQGAWLSA